MLLSDFEPGAYSLMIEDAQGCFELTEVEIAAPQELQVDLGEDLSILLGESINLTAFTNFAPDSFTWTDDLQGVLPNASGTLTITPMETTTYTVLAVDENGCQVEDRVTVLVNRERQIYIPNVFSPMTTGKMIVFGL